MGCFDLLLAGTDLGIGSVDSVFGTVQCGFSLGLGGIRLGQRGLDAGEAVQAQRRSGAAILCFRQGSLRALVGFLRGLQVVVGGVHCVLVGVAGVSVVSRNGAVYGGDSLILGIGSGVQRGGVGADAGRSAVIGGFQRVIVRYRSIVGALGLALVLLRLGQGILGILQILVSLVDLGLQVDEAILVLHGGSFQVGGSTVITGLGRFQCVAVAFFGTFDLLFQVGGVQRGNDVTLFHGIAHGHLDLADLVQLGRVGHSHTGLVAGFDGAVHTHRVGQACLLQGGGAHELVGGTGGLFAAQHSAQHQHSCDQHHQQQGSQLFMFAEPCQRIAPGLYGIFHLVFLPL